MAAAGQRRAIARPSRSVTPQGTGVNVQVVEGDDQLRLTNSLGRRVVVFGYEGEPYLLFEGKRVFRNERSPATYLNQDRYAKVKVPAIADPEARRNGSRWRPHRPTRGTTTGSTG